MNTLLSQMNIDVQNVRFRTLIVRIRTPQKSPKKH